MADQAPDELYRTLSSDVLLDAAIIAVRRDRISTRTGEAYREVVEHFGSAAVVALREIVHGDQRQQEVLLIRQYRRPVDRYLWELPAGLLDHAGEGPLATAQRELAEEAQLAASTWHLLGDIITSPGISEEVCRIFLAEDIRALSPVESMDLPVAEGEEADLTQRWVEVDEAVDMVRRGEMENSIAVAGILHLLAGTRREITTPGVHHSALGTRRSSGCAPGTDLKNVR